MSTPPSPGERNKDGTRPDNNSGGVTSANTTGASDHALRSMVSRIADNQTGSMGLSGTTRGRDTSGPGTASETRSPGSQVSPRIDIQINFS
jgi:hypothetical protein